MTNLSDLTPRYDVDVKNLRGFFEVIDSAPTVSPELDVYGQVKLAPASINTGWKYPTTEGFDINSTSGIWSGWTNPNNVQADDGSFATVFQDGTATNQQNTWGDFDFGIPTSATILGVEFEIKGKTDSGTDYLIFKSGANRTTGIGGDLNEAPLLTTTNTVYSYGSPTTNYGLTGTEVANGNFYVVAYPFQASGGHTLSLDYIKVKVYYTAPGLYVYNNKAGTWLSVTMS